MKVQLEASLRVGRDALYAVPPDLLGLLRSIRRHGSLILALRDVGISHRSARELLRRWEAITGHKLATFTRGQGTGLTTFGARLAGVGEWLEPRVKEGFDSLGGELARYLDVAAEPVKQRVIVHASHDIALLKLKERLGRHLCIELRSIGSLHALDALARGECDVAGFHVPHPPALLGTLLSEFARRLNAREHHVAWLLARHQGLMTTKANARRVQGIMDIPRLRLRFVNREPGSGTRLLFDALLNGCTLRASDIEGYERVERTHMATAAAVRNGTAEVAFGIEAAARAHRLAFVPVVTEHYYLACRRNTPARIALDTMTTAAQSPAFVRAVARLGGYDTRAPATTPSLGELFGVSRC